jgi:hypothetical protein
MATQAIRLANGKVTEPAACVLFVGRMKTADPDTKPIEIGRSYSPAG